MSIAVSKRTEYLWSPRFFSTFVILAIDSATCFFYKWRMMYFKYWTLRSISFSSSMFSLLISFMSITSSNEEPSVVSFSLKQKVNYLLLISWPTLSFKSPNKSLFSWLTSESSFYKALSSSVTWFFSLDFSGTIFLIALSSFWSAYIYRFAFLLFSPLKDF